MMYTSEVYNEDSPYWIDLPWERELPDEEKEGLLMLPYNYDCNDGKFHVSKRFQNCQLRSLMADMQRRCCLDSSLRTGLRMNST